MLRTPVWPVGDLTGRGPVTGNHCCPKVHSHGGFIPMDTGSRLWLLKPDDVGLSHQDERGHCPSSLSDFFCRAMVFKVYFTSNAMRPENSAPKREIYGLTYAGWDFKNYDFVCYSQAHAKQLGALVQM